MRASLLELLFLLNKVGVEVEICAAFRGNPWEGCTVEPLLWDTSIRGTPDGHLHFRRHKIWSRKNVHIIFVFVTSIEGTAHLCSGEWDTFLGPET